MNLSNEALITALFSAVTDGDLKMVKHLLDQKNITANSVAVNTAFLKATKHDHYDIVEVLTRYVLDINVMDAQGWNALNYAVSNKSSKIVLLLIRKGVEVNSLTPSGFSALHIAATHDAVDCAALLLDHGIDIDARDIDGMTPLMASIDAGEYILGPNVARVLIERGADLNIKDNEGETILDYFTYHRSSMTVIDQQLYELVKSNLRST